MESSESHNSFHPMSRRANWPIHKHRVKERRESPDDASRYCSSKVIAPPSCKQSSGDKGGKN